MRVDQYWSHSAGLGLVQRMVLDSWIYWQHWVMYLLSWIIFGKVSPWLCMLIDIVLSRHQLAYQVMPVIIHTPNDLNYNKGCVTFSEPPLCPPISEDNVFIPAKDISYVHSAIYDVPVVKNVGWTWTLKIPHKGAVVFQCHTNTNYYLHSRSLKGGLDMLEKAHA